MMKSDITLIIMVSYTTLFCTLLAKGRRTLSVNSKINAVFREFTVLFKASIICPSDKLC